MTDQISAFIDHMRSVECAPDASVEIIPDDKMRYFRLDGDRPKTAKGSYILRVDDDGFAVGGCMSYRDGQWHKWHSKSSRKATDEERAAWKKKQAEARDRQERERAAEAAAAAEKARRIWAEAERDGSNAYLERKGLTLAQIGCRMSRGSVVVPMWAAKKLVGLQFIDGDGDKLFLKGTAKEGSYHAIPGAGDLIVIGEGLATMAAVQRALGCSAVIAFDAGNLKPVAQAMRKAYPEKRIVIAADADQWTIPANKRPADWDNPPGDDPRWSEWREAGMCVDTGAEKAMQAAVAIGGAVVVAPPFPGDDVARRTDWWDYAAAEGDDAVRAAFETAMKPPVVPDYSPEDMGDGWEPDYGEPVDSEVIDDADQWGLGSVRPLGYDDGTYYFLPKITGQVAQMRAGELGGFLNLQRLAPRSFWETQFRADSEKKICSMAASALMEACHIRGIYNPDMMRGIGAWLEGSECVFNTGAKIVTRGKSVPAATFKSSSGFMYPLSGEVIGSLPEPMSDEEAWEIVRLASGLRWENPLDGYYLIGWVVTGILGGVMRWRPHIYITGDRGAGKSTVLDTLIKRLLGSFAIYADGGSTEAGIRLSIVNSSRTVIMDEAEGNTKADRDKIAAVMNLIRASSSGGHIRNANDEYRCRASFLMAGINPQINNEADKSRIVVIHLRADERPNAAERFVDWQRRVDHVTRAGASGRLIARLIECSHHLPETLRSISAAIRNMGSSARFADQHAALLSGVWLLVKSRAPEGEEAAEFLKKVGLTLEQNTEIEEASGEPWKVLSEIMTSDHRYDVNGMARSATVASIIQMVKHDPDTSAAAAAAAGLSDLGIEVDHDMVRIASTSPRLKRMLINTPWSADGWARHLIALPGAREGKRRAFRGMHRRRTVEVPIDLVLGINEPEEVELPLEDWA